MCRNRLGEMESTAALPSIPELEEEEGEEEEETLQFDSDDGLIFDSDTEQDDYSPVAKGKGKGKAAQSRTASRGSQPCESLA